MKKRGSEGTPGEEGISSSVSGEGAAEAEGGFVTETVNCVRTLGEAAWRRKFPGIPESSAYVSCFLTFGCLCARSHADILKCPGFPLTNSWIFIPNNFNNPSLIFASNLALLLAERGFGLFAFRTRTHFCIICLFGAFRFQPAVNLRDGGQRQNQ